MRTPRQRGQNRRDHRTRPALFLALGPMVVAAPAAAAAVDAHAVDPAAPADSVLQPQLSAGPNGTFTIRVGPPGSSTSSPAPSASPSSTPGDQLPSFPRTTTSSAAPSATPSGGARTGQSSREPALTAAPTTAGASTSTPTLQPTPTPTSTSTSPSNQPTADAKTGPATVPAPT